MQLLCFGKVRFNVLDGIIIIIDMAVILYDYPTKWRWLAVNLPKPGGKYPPLVTYTDHYLTLITTLERIEE